MIFNANNLHNADYFFNFAVSNINNNLNYSIMKAIKKSRENLIKVAHSICDIPFNSGLFFFNEEYFNNTGTVLLISLNRIAVGSSILSMIPSNFTYRLRVVDGCLFLFIWL